MRCSNSFGSITVKAWKISPPQVMVTDSRKNARSISLRVGGAFEGVPERSPSPTISPRHATKSTIPIASVTMPGTMKAARQDHQWHSAPATTGPRATPIEPNMPFQPSARPRSRMLRTTQAMPTG